MSSVGSGGSTKPSPSPKTMVITPSTEASVEDKSIIDNFTQIQFGQRKKYGDLTITESSIVLRNHYYSIQLTYDLNYCRDYRYAGSL
jgi:hypothetical protein